MYSKFSYFSMYLTVCYFLLHSPYLSETKPSSKPSLYAWRVHVPQRRRQPFARYAVTFSPFRNQRQLKAISTSHSPFRWIKPHSPDECNDTAADSGCLPVLNRLSIGASIHPAGNVCSVVTTKAWKPYLSLSNILKKQNYRGITI